MQTIHFRKWIVCFYRKSGNSTVNLTLSGTVENVVTQLNAVSGISAKLVKTTSDGADTYSIVLTSEETGLNNGFQISSSGVSRWKQLVLQAQTQKAIGSLSYHEMHR